MAVRIQTELNSQSVGSSVTTQRPTWKWRHTRSTTNNEFQIRMKLKRQINCHNNTADIDDNIVGGHILCRRQASSKNPRDCVIFLFFFFLLAFFFFAHSVCLPHLFFVHPQEKINYSFAFHEWRTSVHREKARKKKLQLKLFIRFLLKRRIITNKRQWGRCFSSIQFSQMWKSQKERGEIKFRKTRLWREMSIHSTIVEKRIVKSLT